MQRVDESNAPISPQRIEPNKVALLFGSSFMLLAVGGGAPGLFSLELSLIAGGISLPFFGVALSQCKKQESVVIPPPQPDLFTYEKFYAAFVGKPYRLMITDVEQSSISLDPHRLGMQGGGTFDEYRARLAFSIKVMLIPLRHISHLVVEPRYVIGHQYLAIGEKRKIEEGLIESLIPTEEQLHELYKMAAQEPTSPHAHPLPSEEETFKFVQSIFNQSAFITSGRIFRLPNWIHIAAVRDWPSFHTFIETLILNILDDEKADIGNSLEKLWGILQKLPLYYSETHNQYLPIEMEGPEPSFLGVLDVEQFSTKMSDEEFAPLLKLSAHTLASANLHALRVKLQERDYGKRFFDHVGAVGEILNCWLKGDIHRVGLPRRSSRTIRVWRAAFRDSMGNYILNEIQAGRGTQLLENLSSFSIEYTPPTKARKHYAVQLTPAQLSLSQGPPHFVAKTLLDDWIVHVEAAILAIPQFAS